ncbi:MAG: hypothetical protein ACHQT6_05030 [Candidatus Acidiferrales bacterium]
MNSSEGSRSFVRGLLFSAVLLFAISGVAVAQKKPSDSAPSRPAASAPKSQTHAPTGGGAHSGPTGGTHGGNTNTAHRGPTGGTHGGNTNTAHGGPTGGTHGANTNTAHGGPTGGTHGATTNTTHGGTTGGTHGANTNTAHGATTGGTHGATTNTAHGGTTGGTRGATTNTAHGGATNVSGHHPPGGNSKPGANGSTHNFNSSGRRTSVETTSGTRANFNHSGHVSTIHTRGGMTINHGAHGERRFESRRPDGVRVVGYGHGRGYAEHGYYRGGHPYMRRTYFYGGHRYAYAYRGYYWRGHPYFGFVAPYYYAPAFYGWAYRPWGAPIAFGWGWGGAPWYGYYGYYFNPYPVYASPAFWITDYLLAANLQAAYEARAAARAEANADAEAEEQPVSGGGAVALSPEVKQQIADEVRAQIAAQQQAAERPEPAEPVTNNAPAGGGQNAPDEVPAALDPARRTFIVSAVLSESTSDGTECSLSPGDVLTRMEDNPDANQNVKVLVASSQRNDCASGTQVAVAVQDLQDMHNDFQAKISEGLGKLAENQGKNGIPASPVAGAKANPNGQAQPDLTVEADLRAQQDEARQAEKEVQDASANSSND